jgi:Cu(I)/Ag(I) efflux system membrane protein CusA/SilA
VARRSRWERIADIRVTDGPPMLKSENARPSGWIYVDLRDATCARRSTTCRRRVARDVKLPAGYSITWSGQFEYLERATARLKAVVPATLAIIFLLLYSRSAAPTRRSSSSPRCRSRSSGVSGCSFALGHAVSVASAVGFIALAGVAAEFGVVMLLYLKHAWERRLAAGEPANERTLLEALREGAVLRVRPKAMTVAVVMAGLLPIMFGGGTGSEVMQRIAAPMVGGMVTAPLLSMFVIPAAFLLLRRVSSTRFRRKFPSTRR